MNPEYHRPNGQFKAGNGAGRLNANRRKGFVAQLHSAVSPADFKRIVKNMISIACDRDHKQCINACEILFNRLMGQPTQELEIKSEYLPTNPEELNALVHQLSFGEN